MAKHLSEELRSHCDQILLCPCFIVVTAWGMLGFVLPAVAIHHLWRKRTRAQCHFAFHLLSHPPFPSLLHTHTQTRAHTNTHTPFTLHSSFCFSVETSCLSHSNGGLLSIYMCAVKLSPLFSSLCTLYPSVSLFTGNSRADWREGMCCSSIHTLLALEAFEPGQCALCWKHLFFFLH